MNRTLDSKKTTLSIWSSRGFLRNLAIRSFCLVLCGLTLGISALFGGQPKEVQASLPADDSVQLEVQQNIIDSQSQTIDQLEGVLSQALGQEYRGQPFNTMSVTATAYTAREEECNSQPWITASGTPSRVGVIAVSRDMEKLGVRLGDLVIIKGMGLFRVEDRMNKRWSKRVDILHANLKAAKKFAKRKVEIMWLDETETASRPDNKTVPLS
jgi:3D (Asp-Asp-Asp) domain-containing protein